MLKIETREDDKASYYDVCTSWILESVVSDNW